MKYFSEIQIETSAAAFCNSGIVNPNMAEIDAINDFVKHLKTLNTENLFGPNQYRDEPTFATWVENLTEMEVYNLERALKKHKMANNINTDR